MSQKVRIPTPLRKLTNNEEIVVVNSSTVNEAIAELQSRFPASRNGSWMKKAKYAVS